MTMVNARSVTKRVSAPFKRGGLEQGVMSMAGKASSMTAGAGGGLGRLQKAGMSTGGKSSPGGTPVNTGPAPGDSKAGYGGGKSRGGGAATKGVKFKGIYATSEVDFSALQRQRIR